MNRHRFVGHGKQCSTLVRDGVSHVMCGRTLTDPVHDLQEGEGDDAFVTVQFSRELIEQLELKPSEPVTVMIIPPSIARDHYELIATRHKCERPA